MATRIKPPVEWRVDWAGNGQYSHSATNITPWLIEAEVTAGSDLSPYTLGPSPSFAHGIIVLDNTGGRFNVIGGDIDTRDISRLRLIRRLEDGVVTWEGNCRLNIAALAENPNRAVLTLEGRSAKPLGGLVSINDPRESTILGAIIDTKSGEAVGPGPAPPRTRWNATDRNGNLRLAGSVFYPPGDWLSLLAASGRMMGGDWIENILGTQRFIALDDARAAAAAATFADGTYERTAHQQGGPLPGTVFNQAEYVSWRIQYREAAVIARLEYDGVSGTPIPFAWEFRPTIEQRAVLWPPLAQRPVRLSQAWPVTDLRLIDTTLRSPGSVSGIITPNSTGKVIIDISGHIGDRRLAYLHRDDAEAQYDESEYSASVEDFGVAILPIPAWQPVNPDTAGLAAQRRYLRQQRDPLLLVVASWSSAQTDTARTAALRTHAVPGSVVNIGSDKVLIHNITLLDRSDGYSARTVRGLRLNDIPDPPAAAAFPAPGGPGSPLAPATPASPTTNTGTTEVDAVLTKPPGANACSLNLTLVVVEWASAATPRFATRTLPAPPTGHTNTNMWEIDDTYDDYTPPMPAPAPVATRTLPAPPTDHTNTNMWEIT